MSGDGPITVDLDGVDTITVDCPSCGVSGDVPASLRTMLTCQECDARFPPPPSSAD